MNKLEYYRNREGLTQKELSEKTGVNSAYIVRAEKGVIDLKGHQWMSIAKALGCTVEELLS